MVRAMLRRTLNVLALTFAGILAVGASRAGDAGQHPVVVELFTSQGCDTCPPADAVLAQLADRKDIIALSLPVTYWDMLGWKDTLATDANTRRQKAYAEAMGRGGVYTPQMIVDGTTDLVGNRAQAVDAAIAAHEMDAAAVHVSIQTTPSEIHIVVGAAPSSGDATIWLFHILSRATVKVGAGENNGRTLSYRNIVRNVKSIGVWKGQTVTLSLPREDPATPQHDALAVLVQQHGYGKILGAAMIGRPEYR
ncbi:MAG: DUF1223 domain-containing protein [Rhizomicrobium sp.]